MIPASRLGKQIAEIAAMLKAMDAQFALIGGLALASHSVVRATQDVDLLVPLERANDIDAQLTMLGYDCLHRSADAGNYARGSERVNFLYASRAIAHRLLADAKEIATVLGTLRVISPEGLIGFKLQGLVNDPRRTQDLEDIPDKATDQPFANGGGIERPVRRDADPYRTLDDLMVVVEALCPAWPEREAFVTSGKMLL